MSRTLTLSSVALLFAVLAAGCGGDDFTSADSALYADVTTEIRAGVGLRPDKAATVTCPDPPRAGRPGTYACTAALEGDTTSWIATISQDPEGRDLTEVSPVR